MVKGKDEAKYFNIFIKHFHFFTLRSNPTQTYTINENSPVKIYKIYLSVFKYTSAFKITQ